MKKNDKYNASKEDALLIEITCETNLKLLSLEPKVDFAYKHVRGNSKNSIGKVDSKNNVYVLDIYALANFDKQENKPIEQEYKLKIMVKLDNKIVTICDGTFKFDFIFHDIYAVIFNVNMCYNIIEKKLRYVIFTTTDIDRKLDYCDEKVWKFDFKSQYLTSKQKRSVET